MAKEISQEMFDMLTSTMWQDYKGYKRELNLETNIVQFLGLLLIAVIGIISAVASYIEGDVFYLIGIIPLGIAIRSIWVIIELYVVPWYRMSKVNSVAYDIELSLTDVKIIRTKKKKYGSSDIWSDSPI